MATELGRFLSQQLANLPADHDDRTFLEGIARATDGYISKTSLSQGEAQTFHGEIQTLEQGLIRLGKILRDKREEYGMPQTTVGKRARVHRGTIAVLERGEHPKTGKPVRPERNTLGKLMMTLRFNKEEQKELLHLAGYEE